MRTPNQKIKVTDSFLRDCIWMSMRYCIGRHTIAAYSHAKDIARTIRDNPLVFGKGERGRLADDIKNEMNRVLGHNPQVSVVGGYIGSDQNLYDGICSYISENELDISKIKLTIDQDHHTISHEIAEGDRFSYPFGFLSEILYDLSIWNNLCCYLHPTHTISVLNSESPRDGFAVYEFNHNTKTLSKYFVDVKTYEDNDFSNVTLINSQLIKVISK